MAIRARIQTDEPKTYDYMLEYIPRIGEHYLMEDGITYKVTHVVYHITTNKVVIFALREDLRLPL